MRDAVRCEKEAPNGDSADPSLAPTIRVKSRFPWALVPITPGRARAPAFDDADFRWLTDARRKESCVPWRRAHELGWLVQSPVDVVMSPVEQVPCQCPPDDVEVLGSRAGNYELWRRNDCDLLVRHTGWLRLYDYRTPSGWESMFLPNGEGSVEWHLGWELWIPDGYSLGVFTEPGIPGLEVIPAVLSSAGIERIRKGPGMSLAVRPKREVSIRRGDGLARIALLHADSLRARLEVASANGA